MLVLVSNMRNVTFTCDILQDFKEVFRNSEITFVPWLVPGTCLKTSRPLVYSSIKTNLWECTFCTSASSQNTKQKQRINEYSITAHFWMRKDNRAYSLKCTFLLFFMVMVI